MSNQKVNLNYGEYTEPIRMKRVKIHFWANQKSPTSSCFSMFETIEWGKIFHIILWFYFCYFSFEYVVSISWDLLSVLCDTNVHKKQIPAFRCQLLLDSNRFFSFNIDGFCGEDSGNTFVEFSTSLVYNSKNPSLNDWLNDDIH